MFIEKITTYAQAVIVEGYGIEVPAHRTLAYRAVWYLWDACRGKRPGRIMESTDKLTELVIRKLGWRLEQLGFTTEQINRELADRGIDFKINFLNIHEFWRQSGEDWVLLVEGDGVEKEILGQVLIDIANRRESSDDTKYKPTA
jgi:hypothetical protein